MPDPDQTKLPDQRGDGTGQGEVCEYRRAPDFILAKRVVKEAWCDDLPDYARRVSKQAVMVAEAPDVSPRDRLHAADFILAASKHVADVLLAPDPGVQPQQAQQQNVTVNIAGSAIGRVRSDYIDQKGADDG